MSKKRIFEQRSLSERITFAIVFFIFLAFAVSYVYIYVWTFLSGLKTHKENVFTPFGLPKSPEWQHYLEVFQLLKVNGTNYLGMLQNSLIFSLFGPLISITVTSMISYVCSKYKFFGSRIYYVIVIFMITMPIYGSGGARYKLYYNLGLIDSYAYLLTYTSGLGMNFLYFFAMYNSISWSYAEAAFIDGANDWTVYFKIMLPLSLNLFGALFLTAWVGAWNDYSAVLIYLPKLPTLAGGMYLFELEMIYHVRSDILYAAYFIASVPPLILFAVFNKALTSNISLGGIKD